MRYWLLSLLLLVAAAGWAGCCKTDKMCAATETLDKITIANRDARVAYKAVVSERLDAIATEERDARTALLAKASCPLDPLAPQPTDECKKIVAEAQAKYDARKGKVVAVASKLNAASEGVYGALLLAVDILIAVRDGKTNLWPRLTALIADVVKLATEFQRTWTDFKTAKY